MTSFILLQESITNGYRAEFIFFLYLICIFFGISVIITKNPIISVLFLIGLFFSISISLMMLGLYFIGLSYLLVYVGAVSILFLFILMLINVRISELLTEGRNSLPLAIIAVLSFNFSANAALPYSVYVSDIISNYIFYTFTKIHDILFWVSDMNIIDLLFENTLSGAGVFEIANVNSKSWDTLLVETSHIASLGNILYTSLFIFLIVTSLILLLAMVGAIVITIRKQDQNSSRPLSSSRLPLENNFKEASLFPYGYKNVSIEKLFYVYRNTILVLVGLKYPNLIRFDHFDLINLFSPIVYANSLNGDSNGHKNEQQQENEESVSGQEADSNGVGSSLDTEKTEKVKSLINRVMEENEGNDITADEFKNPMLGLLDEVCPSSTEERTEYLEIFKEELKSHNIDISDGEIDALTAPSPNENGRSPNESYDDSDGPSGGFFDGE